MEHPDEEVLTQFALDDPLALDAATLVHISDCDRCTDEIQEIQRVVDGALAAGGRPDLRTMVAPPPSVWERVLVEVGGREAVVAEVEADSAPAPDVPMPIDLPAPSAPVVLEDPIWLFEQPGEIAVESSRGGRSEVDRPSDRRTLWQVAAAAVAGLVVGAGVAWVVADNGSTPTVSGDVKTSTLTGLDGNVTSGEISLTELGGNAPQITVNLDTLDRGPGFLEAWLLDADSGGMVTLGVIDGTKGTFTIPPSLNLSKFNQVDVSREPFDGDPAHSTVSLARGPVPPA
jgi:Anti-sigma-K factor rskA